MKVEELISLGIRFQLCRQSTIELSGGNVQFTGAKGITLFVAIIAVICLAGFGSGILVGRQFPAHSFQRLGDSRYLLDPTTGRVCDPFKDPQADPFAQFAVDPKTGKSPSEISGVVEPTYPPACGK